MELYWPVGTQTQVLKAPVGIELTAIRFNNQSPMAVLLTTGELGMIDNEYLVKQVFQALDPRGKVFVGVGDSVYELTPRTGLIAQKYNEENFNSL